MIWIYFLLIFVLIYGFKVESEWTRSQLSSKNKKLNGDRNIELFPLATRENNLFIKYSSKPKNEDQSHYSWISNETDSQKFYYSAHPSGYILVSKIDESENETMTISANTISNEIFYQTYNANWKDILEAAFKENQPIQQTSLYIKEGEMGDKGFSLKRKHMLISRHTMRTEDKIVFFSDNIFFEQGILAGDYYHAEKKIFLFDITKQLFANNTSRVSHLENFTDNEYKNTENFNFSSFIKKLKEIHQKDPDYVNRIIFLFFKMNKRDKLIFHVWDTGLKNNSHPMRRRIQSKKKLLKLGHNKVVGNDEAFGEIYPFFITKKMIH